MKIVCLIQAHRNSTRLPNKVLEMIGGKTMLQHVVERCQAIRERFPVYVIAPRSDLDLYPGCLAPICPESDLLKRHLHAALALGADAVMRVTSDCPFMDPEAARDVLSAFEGGRYDYVANDMIWTYPHGLGVEIISTEALAYADSKMPPDMVDREHCTPYIIRHCTPQRGNPWPLFSGLNIRCPITGIAGIKLSVDTGLELARARSISNDLARRGIADFSLAQTLVSYRNVQDEAAN